MRWWVDSNDGVEGLDDFQSSLATQTVQSVLDRDVPRILIAEDDDEMRWLLATLLRRDGYEVLEAPDGRRVVEELPSLSDPARPCGVDLVVSDIRMPGIDGLELVRWLGLRRDPPPIILITAFGSERVHDKARDLGAAAVFDKPFEFDDFRSFVRNVIPLPELPADRNGPAKDGSNGNERSN